MSWPPLLAVGLVGTLLWLAGCGKSAPPTLGDAYVAPATLNLRPELGQKTGPAVLLKHGDHLSITDVRRRFVKVLTDQGQEGWLDSSQLLSSAEMDQFKKTNERELRMPSQGAASVYVELNVHLEPNRLSPAITKIPEAGSADILAHKLLPKTTGPAPSNAISLITKPAPARRAKKEKTATALSLRPPKPPPPKAPANWLELSSERIDAASTPLKTPAPPPTPEEGAAKEKSKNAKGASTTAAIEEDWSLVRTKDHLCGWVLTRNLILSIPDDVAQYAEGKRIAAYFDLGIVKDEERGTFHNWLWAIASDLESYDFDSIRLFTWNKRRHRYETSYRERELEGYFPIRVEASEGKERFSLIVRNNSGQYLLRSYDFDGTRAHLLSKDPYQPPTGVGSDVTKAAPLQVAELQARAPKPSWWRRRWDAVKRLFGR